MTKRKKHTRGRAAIPVFALVAAVTLAGCSGTHVGESWQCPLAQGASCDSVAAADPAVPDAAARKPFSETPLRGARRGTARGAARRGPATPDAAVSIPSPGSRGCSGAAMTGGGRGCRPRSGDPGAGSGQRAAATPVAETPAVRRCCRRGRARRPSGLCRIPPTAICAPARSIGRIWIAPFVDADGVYREAFHVRAVLEPAGWRLR